MPAAPDPKPSAPVPETLSLGTGSKDPVLEAMPLGTGPKGQTAPRRTQGGVATAAVVLSARVGENAELFAQILGLHVAPGSDGMASLATRHPELKANDEIWVRY